MNKISNKQITDYVENQLKQLYSIYDEKQILGIFTYGKVNYDFAQSIDDIETLFVYLPSYPELCSIKPDFEIKTFINLNDNQKIKKVDIRGIYNFASLQDSIMMEALCSDFQIINPRYKKVFKKYFLSNKELIFHCDILTRVENVVTIGKQIIKDYLEKEDNKINNLFKACYLRIACRLYLDGVASENCINLKRDYHKVYLEQILKGTITPNINEVLSDYDYFIQEAKEQYPFPNRDIYTLIAEGIQEILKVSLTDLAQTDDFLNKLTDLEKQALSVILDNLADGYEGNISVSQLVNSSSISRPVFKSVLDKMKDNSVAEWENKGVKGTYVKIIDGNLLSQ